MVLSFIKNIVGLVRSQFFKGWALVFFSALVPIFISLIIDITATIRLNEIEVKPIREFDPSYLYYYLVFSIIHIAICIAITYLTYDIYKNSSSAHLYKIYKKHQLSAFVLVSFILVATIMFFNSALEVLSSDLLKIATDTRTEWFFDALKVSILDSFDIEIVPFFLVPLLLVIAAFAPAISIMHIIQHFIVKIKIYDHEELTDKLNGISKRFEFLYSMMLVLFISSTIATFLYMRVPRSFIAADNLTYFKYTDTVFGVWCLVYFLILLVTSCVTYISFSRVMRPKYKSHLVTGKTSDDNIDYLISTHGLLRNNSLLFIGPFTPIITLFVSKMLT